MNINGIESALVNQCMSLPALCEPQIRGVREGLKAVPGEILKKCRRVIITGCGDSYAAAQAAIPAFKKFGGRFGNNFSFERAIHAARYYEFDPRYSDSTLVIGVSCSGGPARVTEVLKRANHYGCHTLALTNNPDSPAAREAEFCLHVGTPAFPDSNPGLRNYYASLAGLFMLAARYGEAAGVSPEGTLEDLERAIAAYTAAYEPCLEQYGKQMYELAKQWKDCRAYDFIGDDTAFCTAFFCAAKITETSGGMTNVDDSEDWCHVPFFQKEPHRIGTCIIADKFANDRSRIGETVKQAAGIGRPVLLVANGTKEDFGIAADITVCRVPKAPEGWEFLLPMMNYIPGAMLAGCISALLKEPYFRGGGPWANPAAQTIRSSEIKVV